MTDEPIKLYLWTTLSADDLKNTARWLQEFK
jgi:hypothetical protein